MARWLTVFLFLLSAPAFAGYPVSYESLRQGGGMVLGQPHKIGSDWVVPVRCVLTAGIEGLETRVENRVIYFRVMAGEGGSPMCPDATLLLPGGQYEVYYDDPAGPVSLGSINLVE